MNNPLDIDAEIGLLLDDSGRVPSDTLAYFACEQGWIGTRHRNWCINMNGETIQDERRRVYLREVCYYIFQGYIRSLRSKNPQQSSSN